MTFRLTRRRFLSHLPSRLGAVAAASLLQADAGRADDRPATGPDFAPKAKRAIWLFMGGGPSQLDLFDYKPGLSRRFNEDLPPSVRGTQRLSGLTSNQDRFPVAPSVFPFQQAGQSGTWVSDLLPWTRRVVDDLTLIKTVSTESINHEPGILNISTGSQLPGKPALGAWLSYGLGRINENLPGYVVMTSSFSSPRSVQPVPTRVWGSGFLPDQYAGVPLRGVGDPVLYLSNPAGVDAGRRRSMLDALAALNRLHYDRLGAPETLDRIEQYELAFRMQSAVPPITDVREESAETLALYGPQVKTPGTFAANCLTARRLLEKGVRFVQIFHRGWDAHFTAPEDLRLQCGDIDQATYGLLQDLKRTGLLADTLVIWGGEFGRTVYSQGELTATNYGRDHHPRCFSMWLAGAGVRPGMTYGETDDFSYNVVRDEVPLRDLHATLLHLFGLNPQTLSFRHAGLEEKLVGVGPPAKVIQGILA